MKKYNFKQMERLLEKPGSRTIKSDSRGLYLDTISETEEITISRDEKCLAVFRMDELVDADIFYKEQLLILKATIPTTINH